MGSQTTYRFPFASYPAVRIVLLLIAGILINWYLSIPVMLWGIILFSFAALIFLFNYLSARSFNTAQFRATIIFYLIFTVSFGGFWHAFQTNAEKPLTQNLLDVYTWEIIQIEGELYSFKQTSTGKYQLDVETSAITFNDSVKTTTPVNIRAVWDPDKMPLPDKLSLGDQVGFAATVYPLEAKRNPYQFDYKNYLSSLNIFTQVGVDSLTYIKPADGTISWANLRQSTLNLIDQNFGAQTSSLAKALLIGYKNELDRNEKIAFSRVGLSHIMAVSGLHVGFLLAPFWFLIPYVWTFKYGRQIGLIFLIGLLLFYAGLTGFSASVTRASITGGFIMYGRLFNKVRDTTNLTALAAIIILLFDPAELFEIGFQLSFGAVYIILLVMPAINRALPATIRFHWYGKLLMIILVSIVVQVGLFPLLSYYFGEFSLIGPLANAIVIPGLTIIVPYALFLLLVSSVMPVLGDLLNTPSDWFLLKLNQFVTFTASWEGSWIQTYINDPFIFALWIAAIFAIASWHIPKYRWKLTAIFLAIVCLQQSYQLIQKFEPPNMQVTIFDVGQGDAALIKTPQNKHFLVDAGIWNPDYNSARYIIIPHLKAAGISKLDAIFLSHPHADHIGGIKELINKVPIDTIYNSGYQYNSNLYNDYLELASRKGVPVVPLQAGEKVNLDPAMLIFVYGPKESHTGDEPNEHSLILELIYGETEFLFMGDAGAEQEERLLSAYPDLLDTDFVKVGHHGSKTSSSSEFLSRASAQWSIISVAKSNRFRHPHVEAVQRLQNSDSKLRFTSLEKAMIFTSDGTSIKLKRWY